jgi:hypothetical protein
MEIRVDGRATESWLERLFADQLPYATSVALNHTAKAVQAAIRASIERHFTIRRPWVLQGITIPRFSDKRDQPMVVTVQLDPQRAFLGKFEAGGAKAGSPELPIAIPSTALRPSFAGSVPLAFYPKNLRLAARRGVTGFLPALRHRTSGGVEQLQGKERTFVLDQTMFGVAVAGIYQRVGPGPHDIRLLWTYKAHIPIPARLRYYATALETVQGTWSDAYAAAFTQAVRTAR